MKFEYWQRQKHPRGICIRGGHSEEPPQEGRRALISVFRIFLAHCSRVATAWTDNQLHQTTEARHHIHLLFFRPSSGSKQRGCPPRLSQAQAPRNLSLSYKRGRFSFLLISSGRLSLHRSASLNKNQRNLSPSPGLAREPSFFVSVPLVAALIGQLYSKL